MPKKLIAALPAGERFVDLFGGGAAMTQAAAESGKYKKVWYNDYNPLLVQTVTDAIHGKYNSKVFTPEWISREDFKRLKDTDGYVKWVWSWSNAGTSYIYGTNKEVYQRQAHNLICFGEHAPLIEAIKPGICEIIANSRLEWPDKRQLYRQTIGNGCWYDMDCLSSLEGIERLGNLEIIQSLINVEKLGDLQRVQALEGTDAVKITCKDYREYSYEAGDIVYCDIPYEKAAGYTEEFDHGAFYDWVATRPYPVWFSGYDNCTDGRFETVWSLAKKNLNGGSYRQSWCTECLYTQSWNKDGLLFGSFEGRQLSMWEENNGIDKGQ